jgi:hypothetical protein
MCMLILKSLVGLANSVLTAQKTKRFLYDEYFLSFQHVLQCRVVYSV